MDWKIILVLVILVGTILIICWYSCPSRERHNIPWRPDSDKYKAPNVGFTNQDGSPLENPYTGCSKTQKMTIYWVCDYSTTIYNPEFVNFNLTADVELPQEWSGTINGNIKPSDTEYHEDPSSSLVYYTYTYETSPNDIPPGSYTLHLNSFVNQSENIPKGQKADSDVTDGSMIIYKSQPNGVSNVTTNDSEGESEDFYIGENLIAKWVATDQSFPSPSITYNVGLVDSEGSSVPGSTHSGITGTSYTFPALNSSGTFSVSVNAVNEDCNVMSLTSYSDPFTVDYPPVPSPTIISSTSFSNLSCSYMSNSGACDNQDLIIYWCVDFTDSPEYNPKSSGDPDFIINITGDSTNNFQLKGVVEDSDDGNIFFYKYNFGNVVAGIYTITLTTDAPYNGGDKQSSDPSKATKYTVYQYPDPPYKIPDGGIYYDRDPPIYKTNDTMVISWDPAPIGDAYPDPTNIINYNWYINVGDGHFSCGTGTHTSTTITLKDGANKSCSPPTYSFDPGQYSLSIQTGMFDCYPPNQTTYAPNFTVVECLDDDDCSNGDVCVDNTCQASG